MIETLLYVFFFYLFLISELGNEYNECALFKLLFHKMNCILYVLTLRPSELMKISAKNMTLVKITTRNWYPLRAIMKRR